MQEDLLKNYVEAVLKFQQEKQNTRWTLAELESFSKNLGLTEEDLTQIEEHFKACLDRGNGFLYYQHLEKAIPELEMAVTLKPLHAEALYATAQAYTKQWQKKRLKKDFEKALEYAERTLQSDPRHQGAIKLISDTTKNNQKRNNRNKTFLWIVSVIIVGISISLFLNFWLNTNENTNNNNNNTIIEQKNIYINENQGEIPLKLIIAPTKEKIIDVDIHSSFWRKNNEKKDYYAKLIIKSNTLEIQSFEAKLQLFDEENQKIIEEEWNLENDFKYEIRPEDEFPLNKIIQNIPNNIKEAKLLITNIKYNQPEKYESSKIIDIEYENLNKNEYQLKIKERHQLIETEADGFYHTLQFEIENKTKKTLNYLKLKVIWYDDAKQPIYENEIITLQTQQAPQKRGSLRTFQQKFWIPHKRNEYEQYKIFVTEIK